MGDWAAACWRWRCSSRRRSDWISRRWSKALWNWRESCWQCRPRVASVGIRVWGLGFWQRSSSSSEGTRLMRRAVSTSCWVSRVSVGVGRLIFVEEPAAVELVSGGVLGGEDGGAAGGRHSFIPLSVPGNLSSGSVGLRRPWVMPFMEKRCLPAAVRGPVDLGVRAWGLGIGGWRFGIGVGIGFVMEASSSVVA